MSSPLTEQGIIVSRLGQAGLALECRSSGGICLVDPYLTHSIKTVSRTAPIVLDPRETSVDVVVNSHWHDDHLDRLTCELLKATNPEVVFTGPQTTVELLRTWGFIENVIAVNAGDSVTIGPFSIHGCFARHEIPVPEFRADDATSLLVEVGGVRLFHSGDGQFDPVLLKAVERGPIDVGFYSINGTGGNMNAHEAALLAYLMRPRLAVPMHYDMWSAADYGREGMRGPTLDPEDFGATYELLGGGNWQALQLGEPLELMPATIR